MKPTVNAPQHPSRHECTSW